MHISTVGRIKRIFCQQPTRSFAEQQISIDICYWWWRIIVQVLMCPKQILVDNINRKCYRFLKWCPGIIWLNILHYHHHYNHHYEQNCCPCCYFLNKKIKGGRWKDLWVIICVSIEKYANKKYIDNDNQQKFIQDNTGY